MLTKEPPYPSCQSGGEDEVGVLGKGRLAGRPKALETGITSLY